MATKIFVGPYVHGPEPNSAVTKAAGGSGWMSLFKAIARSLTGVSPIRSAVGDRDRSATPNPSAAEARWAYRVTNYHRLRAAGLTCLITPPNAAAGISSHLDLEAVEPAQLREADVFLVESGQFVPADGTILEGISTVDEAAVTGQSAPVAHSAAAATTVMRDCRIVEGQIIVQVAPLRGHRLDWIGGSAQLAGRASAGVAG